MGILDSILGQLGIKGPGGAKKKSTPQGPLGLPGLPDPREVKDTVEKVMEGLSELKDLPQSLVKKAMEAEEDYRDADKAFRGSKFKAKKKK